jgi:hypothetical protein
MKILLDVPDEKVGTVMGRLRGISRVRATPLSCEKARLIREIGEAVENLNRVRKGRLVARSVKNLLDELQGTGCSSF